jgi:hypothetical protein
MKNLIYMLIVLTVLSFTACAQEHDVPAKVKTAFEHKFPKAKKVKWDKENATEWEAEFKMNGMKYSANFTAEGDWKETEYEIEESEIPPAVRQTLANEFAGYEIEEAEVSETVDGKVYEFALEKDETKREVAISPDGKVVKNIVQKDNETEENETEDND